MKTIGIIGGLGPHSTVKYYEWLTQGVQDALGGVNSAKIILTSLNGEEIKNIRMAGDKDKEGALFAAEAKKLENAGADFLLIASNTSHKNVPYIEAAVSIPLLHLADATAKKILNSGVDTVALLGTAPTMEHNFYKSRLIDAGLNVIVPDDTDRVFISDTIYSEMVKGIVRPEVNVAFETIIKKMEDAGAKGVILGCTELTLLDLKNVSLPLFDTLRIHVDAALELTLS